MFWGATIGALIILSWITEVKGQHPVTLFMPHVNITFYYIEYGEDFSSEVVN